VILRQIFTLLENQHLTTQLRTFNADLEQIVVRRTVQLQALHQLTKAVHRTRLVDEVIEAALKHTRQALPTDAIVLQLVGNGASKIEPLPSRTLHQGLEEWPQILDFIDHLPLVSEVHVSMLPDDIHAGCYLRAPLLWQTRPIGMIGVLRWEGGFEGTEPDLLESIGLEVGTAYENARLYAVAVEAADRDPVTGLYNHRAVHQRLDLEFQRATVQDLALAVIMMDLNNFKLFNDTYGHPIGDQVLKRVATVLREECRAQDILARYGGDEFIVLLPETDGATAMLVAQRLRERMSQEGFSRSGDERTIPVTLSFGIAAFPADATNRHELLTVADANLYAAKLSEEGIKGTTDLQRTQRELRNSEGSFDMLDAMVTAVDNKDRYTRRHSEDVTEYALWIADELRLSEETMRIIRVGGLLHDVGKIGVPEEILHKPGRLTEEEFEILKHHPHLGALIVAGVPGMENIIDAVRSHHERWDGKGYPDGLEGANIPFLGRLMAVADAFSAMTTSRPYRMGLELEEALREIVRNIGSQFDPTMSVAFLQSAQKRHPELTLGPEITRLQLPAVQLNHMLDQPDANSGHDAARPEPPMRPERRRQ